MNLLRSLKSKTFINEKYKKIMNNVKRMNVHVEINDNNLFFPLLTSQKQLGSGTFRDIHIMGSRFNIAY